MTDRNQNYWEQADWALLREFVEDRDAWIDDNDLEYPEKVEIDHRYFEDLRKRLWLLEHLGAGTFEDPAANTWPPGLSSDFLYKEFQVLVWYEGHYFINTHDAYGSALNIIAPPEVVYDEENKTWDFRNGHWVLYPHPNKYHHWDTNSPCFYGWEEQSAPGEASIPSGGMAFRWYPRQTDPKCIYRGIIYQDTMKKGFQYRHKLEFDSSYITQPDTLGAVFGWFSNRSGAFAGRNQYARTGGFGDSDLKDNNSFFSNPKMDFGLQNRIELLLNYDEWRYPVDDNYAANWESWETGTFDTKNSKYDSHPGCNNAYWGENSSGFELFKKKTGDYDWYFDLSYQYIPNRSIAVPAGVDNVAEKFLTSIDDGWSTAKALTEFDLTDLVGTWRRTWKNSLGRLSAFIRAGEAGEPTRTDDWSPTVDSGCNGKTWCGSRKTSYPVLSEFINTTFNFTKKENTDSVIILEGDQRDNIKVGWQVFICNSTSLTIDNLYSSFKIANVSKIKFIDDNTEIYLTTSVGEYTKICFDSRVCERHDPTRFGQDGVAEYEIKAGLLLEIKDLLDIVVYKRITIDLEGVSKTIRKGCGNIFLGEDACPLGGRYAKTLSEYKSTVSSQFDNPAYSAWDSESGQFDVGTLIGANEIFDSSANGGVGEWLDNRVVVSVALAAAAFRIEEGIDYPEALNYSSNALVRVSYHVNDTSNPAGDVFTQTAGGLSIPPGYEDPGYTRYSYVSCGIVGEWFSLMPGNLFPSKSTSLPDYPSAGDITNSESGTCQLIFELDADGLIAVLDWEKPPASVFERDMLDHIKIAETPVLDNNPPKTPVWQYYPQAEFKYVPESGTEGELDYIAEHFELWISGTSCLCEDLEGSDPVKYRIFGHGEVLSSNWTEDRAISYKIRDLTMREALGGRTYDLNGDVTQVGATTAARIPCSHGGGILVDDEVEIDCAEAGYSYICIHTVTNVSDNNHFDIDLGTYYGQETFDSATDTVIILSGYAENEWNLELCKEEGFSLQSKDSNIPINNEGKLSRIKEPAEPEKYPKEIYIEDKGF